MEFNSYLVLILVLLVGAAFLDTLSDVLNVRHLSDELPDEFKDIYDAEKYTLSQRYLKENTSFAIFQRSMFLLVTLAFILLGGFNRVDQFVRSLGQGPIITGILFAGALSFLKLGLSLPFSYYDTFVIEEKYGFNKMTRKTFIGDLAKGLLVTALLGAPLFAVVIYFFERFGALAWLYSWAIFTATYLAVAFFAPVVLMPLFNKFEPLPEGELKQEILKYATTQNFHLNGVYTMDGSKRSTKANAFFTGFGKFRRLVLFDTLMAKHTVDELVAVLAHEIGHFKRRHIPKFTVISILSTGLMLFILSLFIGNPALFAAFQMEDISVYASLIFVGFLYGPILRFLSIFVQRLSRKFEFEADAFAATTYGRPETLATALKKLSVDNLSNLTPHPLKVMLDYSHPPVMKRIEALRRISQSGSA